MTRRFLVCFAVPTVIFASLIWVGSMLGRADAATAAENGEPNEKIKELMQKRLVAVTEIHKLLQGFHGRSSAV